MPQAASIDLGTNTFRLLVANIGANGTIHPVRRERIITRLGEGLHASGIIQPPAWQRSLQALLTFKHILARHRINQVCAVATSGVRDARNGREFTRDLERKTGITVHIISGTEEAGLTLAGVAASVGVTGRTCIVDIGGGSTELILAHEGRAMEIASLPLGAVHLCEALLRSDPPTPLELTDLAVEIGNTFDDWLSQHPLSLLHTLSACDTCLIGTAGSITTLAAVDLALRHYDPNAVNRHRLSRHRVLSLFDRLIAMQRRQRQTIPGLEVGREDIIVAGTSILLWIMNRFGFDELIVSDGGLLEGILIAKFGSPRAIK